ncbi:dTDP-4-dehydrorhamnose 3,5-epimerase [uncultured Alsobacter sp.]|uniref:dTDP-4-dehydrorhamnose 3,5-epimerase n=1 Tax=uncultured Alsobacter sp. TaxID=1748258 RepID=UPI0025D5EC56|nr:dTDP-4-dehydrorhamnose 3,5-epimerase [uncultured Alsobacter sp.]
MQVETFPIAGVMLVRPVRHGDTRGWFEETFRADRYAEAGIADAFVQDNQSFSARKGTVRGLHFQLAPFAQSKLIRVLSGAILDVAVDLRRSSPTFGRHVAVRLDAAGGAQLYVPVGFAHGFCTLEPDTAIAYKVGAYYSREHDRGIRWDDPDLGIDWPVTAQEAELSDKDRVTPFLRDVGQVFA